MRCYGIAVSELPEIGRKDTAVPQMNQSFLSDARDRDNPPVCCPKTGLMAIGGDQKPVTSGNFKKWPFIHVKALCLLSGDCPQLAALITDYQSVIFYLRNLGDFILCNSLYCAVEAQELARAKVAHVALLSRRPAQGNISPDLNAIAQLAGLLPRRANGLRNAVDLLMRRADHKRISSL